MEEYRIRSYDVEILRSRANGATCREIAEEKHISQRTVQRRLAQIRKLYPHVRDFVLEVEGNKSLKKVAFKGSLGENPRVEWLKRRWKNGYHTGSPPYGYEKDGEGDLIQIPEKAALVKRVFEGKADGKSMRQLASEIGPSHSQVECILHNPVYKGLVGFRGNWRPGRHKAITSKELWERCQRKPDHPFGANPLPFGYKYVEGKPTIDENEAAVVKKMFDLRIEGRSFAEIGRQLDMPGGTVLSRIKNPFYAAKKWEDGKWVDMDHEPIISFERWFAASRVATQKWKVAVEKNRMIGELNRSRILAFVEKAGPVTTPQVEEAVHLTCSAVHKRLKKLCDEGLVERIVPERKPPGRLPFKWRVRI